MTGDPRRPWAGEAAVMALLALLPVLAYAPALREGRLLGPGDGAALHYPLRAEAWAAYRRGELPSWTGAIFSGAPLLPRTARAPSTRRCWPSRRCLPSPRSRR